MVATRRQRLCVDQATCTHHHTILIEGTHTQRSRSQCAHPLASLSSNWKHMCTTTLAIRASCNSDRDNHGGAHRKHTHATLSGCAFCANDVLELTVNRLKRNSKGAMNACMVFQMFRIKLMTPLKCSATNSDAAAYSQEPGLEVL